MERSPRKATAVADVTMLLLFFVLAALAAVMPSVVIAVGLPAFVGHQVLRHARDLSK